MGYATFVREADALGLDVERFKTDFQTREVADALQADLQLARKLGVSGTPGFFVNGRYLQGARNSATFAELIDADLVRAKELAAAGTPRAELHEALMREAIGPADFPNSPASHPARAPAGQGVAPVREPSPNH
jgi:2-hydroxychromene-2-carboxylate isomerase